MEWSEFMEKAREKFCPRNNMVASFIWQPRNIVVFLRKGLGMPHKQGDLAILWQSAETDIITGETLYLPCEEDLENITNIELSIKYEEIIVTVEIRRSEQEKGLANFLGYRFPLHFLSPE